MAAAAQFVQTIPIFLAYLVPLDVDKGNNKITELRTILQRESPNS